MEAKLKEYSVFFKLKNYVVSVPKLEKETELSVV